MKAFFYKTGLYLAVGLICFLTTKALIFGLVQSGGRAKNFNSAFVDKLKLLQKYRDQQKIVLYGGSSVAFGLSAKQIEKATHLKTINLGHHAGFGLVDFRDFILANLTPNDLIIFSPEWHFYTLPENYDPATLDNLIHNNFDYGELLGKKEYMTRSVFLCPTTHSPQHLPYIYDCLNTNGDIITHCGMPSIKPLPYDLPDKGFDFAYFKKTFPFISQNNTLILFPPTQALVYEKNKLRIEEIEKELRDQGLQLANAASDNVYPESSFFDATYHLDCTTRKIRTDSLISAIFRSN